MYLREPIRELAGPSAAQMFQDKDVNQFMARKVEQDLDQEVTTAFKNAMKGYGQ